MSELANPWYLDGVPACGLSAGIASVGSLSPDGRRLVIVLRKGDVTRNVNVFTMLLWNTAAIGEPPRTILQMSSSSFLPAIDPTSISWDTDSRSLSFLGEQAGGRHKVFQLDVDTGKVSAITHSSTDITDYSRDTSGSTVLYEALAPVESLWDAATARRGLDVTTESVLELLFGEKETSVGARMQRLQLIEVNSGATRAIPPLPGSHFVGDPIGRDWHRISVSPNGRFAVVVESVPVGSIPLAWHEYTDWAVQWILQWTQGWLKTEDSELLRYVLVDLRTGGSRVLLDAPVVTSRPAIWAPDSRSVILSQTLLPLSGDEQKDAAKRGARETVAVDITTGRTSRVGSGCYLATSWKRDVLTCESEPDYIGRMLKARGNSSNSHAVRIHTACSAPGLVALRKTGDFWRVIGRPVTPSVDVFLTEGMNSPPKFYYRSRGARGNRMLWDPNPQFKQLRLGVEMPVTWSWSKGKQITGGLYYPTDYRAGQRYPLVIQTHGFNANRFEFFGPFSTAFAARPLAAHHMFVLQVNDVQLSEKFGPYWEIREADVAMSIYKSAIEYLSDQGLIDKKKVGIIGFSFTCFHVKWAIAGAPSLFAVASVTDGVDGGYLQYLINGQYDLGYSHGVDLYGGSPFGPHISSWVRLAPSFNLARVRAPLLITVIHNRMVLSDWEWFDGLRELHKPVDMVVLDGRTSDVHMLRRPWDRAISAGGNVQWFDYWLNGHKDPSPDKEARYYRWGKLRARGEMH